MPNAAIVYNPVAGAGLGERRAQEAKAHLEARGWQLRLLPTRDRHGAEPIVAEVAHEIDLLVVAGGDGTLREAIEGAGERLGEIEVGLLPLGNANVAAQELGIPIDARAAIPLLSSGSARSVDLARFRMGSRNRLVLAMVGIGWDAITVRLVDRLRQTAIGRAWYRFNADSLYLVCGLLALIQRQGASFEIEVDGRPLGERFRAAHICNFRTYSKGMAIAPTAHAQSGRLHYQARRRDSVWATCQHLLAARRSRAPAAGLAAVGEGRRLRVRAEGPLQVQIDGDYYGEAEHAEVEILPGALRILVPVAASAGGEFAMA